MSEKIKLIIAGGRDFSDFDFGFRAIDHMVSHYGYENIKIVCGKAPGGDTCGEEYYLLHKEEGMRIEYFIPDWNDISKPDAVIKYNRYDKPYNARAGMDRNHEMGDYATHLIAFWDEKSRGTKDMINYMKSLDKPVKVFTY